jgi:hypothetical protein
MPKHLGQAMVCSAAPQYWHCVEPSEIEAPHDGH